MTPQSQGALLKELRSEAQHQETDARNNIETKGQNQWRWNVSRLKGGG